MHCGKAPVPLADTDRHCGNTGVWERGRRTNRLQPPLVFLTTRDRHEHRGLPPTLPTRLTEAMLRSHMPRCKAQAWRRCTSGVGGPNAWVPLWRGTLNGGFILRNGLRTCAYFSARSRAHNQKPHESGWVYWLASTNHGKRSCASSLSSSARSPTSGLQRHPAPGSERHTKNMHDVRGHIELPSPTQCGRCAPPLGCMRFHCRLLPSAMLLDSRVCVAGCRMGGDMAHFHCLPMEGAFGFARKASR